VGHWRPISIGIHIKLNEIFMQSISTELLQKSYFKTDDPRGQIKKLPNKTKKKQHVKKSKIKMSY
jgi:hypothetical protein